MNLYFSVFSKTHKLQLGTVSFLNSYVTMNVTLAVTALLGV